jgi:hypothetical protein
LFASKVMPRFFPRKSKYSSFTRKLNRWYVHTIPIVFFFFFSSHLRSLGCQLQELYPCL